MTGIRAFLKYDRDGRQAWVTALPSSSSSFHIKWKTSSFSCFLWFLCYKWPLSEAGQILRNCFFPVFCMSSCWLIRLQVVWIQHVHVPGRQQELCVEAEANVGVPAAPRCEPEAHQPEFKICLDKVLIRPHCPRLSLFPQETAFT